MLEYIAPIPVLTTLIAAELSIAQQEGHTLMIVFIVRSTISLVPVDNSDAVAPATALEPLNN